ncbi:MAG TPA: hypothetical protein PKE06_21950 [Flavilitoribacter sp.]|nr:hypothetical protein [Flavilitoribacter sp.]
MRLAIFLFICTLFTSITPLKAQDNLCENGYMPFKEGISYELTTYDKKDKVSSVNKSKIEALESIDGGFKATVAIEVISDKGKELHKGSYAMECRDGVIYMDLNSLMDPRSMGGLSNMEMEMSGDALELPADMDPGQSLPDGHIEMKAKSGGMSLMTFTMNVTDRKVEAAESVTTPAGTFECVRVSQNMEMKAIIKRRFKTVTWYAKGVGAVLTENYDDKGKKESYTQLTKFGE